MIVALWQARRGAVAVETALVLLLVLLPLFAAGWDFAVVLTLQSRLDAALAGGLFVAYTGGANASSTTGVTNAAASAYGAATPSLATNAASLGYACIAPTGTRPSALSATVPASCPSGQSVATYLTVTVGASASLPLPIPVLAGTVPLARSGVVRVN
ncbi:MAG: pilus assembly protein [Rhodospirillales bacterium]|nr:pilus assembly protein [Rhodospirillales bacterium]MDE2198897.1 pilus assembly protein [Rhodospirillales bacterium]MDE2576126.1 pilus assembly protein [Rhodospirillales bacterium]